MVTLEDNLAIRELIYRYGYAADAHDWDEIGRIFTPDAEFDSSVLGLPVVSGIDGIVAHLSKRRIPTAHIFTNLVVFEQEGQTVVRAKALTPNIEGQVVVTTIRDTVVRTEDGWRIARQFCEGILRPGPEMTRG